MHTATVFATQQVMQFALAARKGGVMLTPDEQSVLQRLEAFLSRVEQIQQMFNKQGTVPAEHVDGARELYTSLNRDLEAEYISTSRSRRRPPLTGAEQQWYASTVHEAHVHFSAPTNSSPEKWFSCLYDAEIDLAHTISGMRQKAESR
jgi:hypothetical protein